MTATAFAPSELDPLEVPLSGIAVVEASAGTGKTFNLVALYLRLLLETDLTVDRILVVTYTLAAKAELRSRLRVGLTRLETALRERERGVLPDPDATAAPRVRKAGRDPERAPAARVQLSLFAQDESDLASKGAKDDPEPGASALDPVKDGFLIRLAQRVPSVRAARIRIENALRGLDEAAVYTIHGFCQRVLEGSAFESGVSFDAELITDQGDLLRECVRDFWRRDTYEAAPEYVRFLLENGIKGPVVLVERLMGLIGRPTLRTLTPTTTDEADVAKRASTILARVRASVESDLASVKRDRGQLYYDDLVLEVARALDSPRRRDALVAAVRRRYGAALIDEFQDTDDVQYQIFRQLFGDGAPLFLIGDPKQAIFQFRGADVYSYLRARRDAQHQYTLTENYRSDSALVDAVNAVFTQVDAPFVLDDIHFLRSRAARPDQGSPADAANTAEAPLEFWLLARATGVTKALTKKEALPRAAESVADEVAALLERARRGEVRVGEKPVHARDIAILVKKHEQGHAVRRALAARGIASVEQSTQSVLESTAAEQVERLLRAVAEPQRERLLRAALATDLLGYRAEDVADLAESEDGWEREIERFLSLRELFVERGPAVMLARLLADFRTFERLLARPDGERRLTDVLHIVELLQQEASRSRQSPEKLVRWLATRRSEAKRDVEPEEHLLRLESDEDLVRISTVHASKGLEYDIVFCPYVWDGPTKGPGKGGAAAVAKPILFHDPDHDLAPTVDFGSERYAEAATLQERERLAEDLRLLYVALTRARHRCVVIWCGASGAERTGLAWLLRRNANTPAGEKLGTDAELMNDLQRLAGSAPHAIRLRTVEPESEQRSRVRVARAQSPSMQSTPLEARHVTREIASTWRISSFSSFKAERGSELADRDGHTQATVPPEEDPLAARLLARDIFSFERGARAGLLLHRVLERIDFTDRTTPALERIVATELEAHRIGAEWSEVIVRTIRDAIATPLDEAGAIRLADVARRQRLAELSFFYPSARLELADLNALLVRYGLEELRESKADEPLPAPLADGFLHGVIDLVFEAGGRFYLADYKSNWLGASVAAYAPERLAAVMRDELYALQYVIYTLAVHRMLRVRVPDYDYQRHFGGVMYLFLRGMRPELGHRSGIYFTRPPAELIAELDVRVGG